MIRFHKTILESALMLIGSIGSVHADTTVTVVPGVNWGQWEGWGVSLCWWAKAYGADDELADVFFTQKVVLRQGQALPGLGFNIVRYNAGASGSNEVNGMKMIASPTITSKRQMEGFWLNPNSADPKSKSWDWTLDANQRAMLLKAKERGANYFELFSNSPMWWMCKHDNPSGDQDANHDNLAPENYRAHAVYLATVAEVAREKWGVAFTSVEPFNEPIAPYWHANGTQEGCHFSRESQRAVIGYLREELDRRGLSSSMIAASDETAYDQATKTWNSFDQATKDRIGRVNVHGYQADGDRAALFAAVAGKKLWNSEYGEEDGSGLKLAKNLTMDLRLLHPTAWCYWQAIDGGGWGLLASSNRRRPAVNAAVVPPTGNAEPREANPARTNVKYFVLAQYTRHIRPGMRIIDSGAENSVAAYDPKKHSLVIVTLNLAAPQTMNYDLSGFKRAVGPVTRWTTRSDGEELYVKREDLKLTRKRFSCSFGTNTVQTFEIQNVRD